MSNILNRRFRYHSAASHATTDGLKARMRRYAEQVKREPAKSTVTPIKKAKRNG